MPEISTHQLIECQFANGRHARLLYATDALPHGQVLSLLQFRAPLSNLVVIGGASKMEPESLQRLFTVFEQVLAPLAQELDLAVLDGGTDAGVIQMMGQARGTIGGTFELLGVAPQSKVRLPLESAGEQAHLEALEPHHTAFCLVPGDDWGSESPWLAQLATSLAGSCPSVTLLINGGKIALVDLQANLATGRPAIAISGSGRLADAITTAIADPDAVEPAVAAVVKQYYPHQLSTFALSSPLSQLTARLRQILMPDDQ